MSSHTLERAGTVREMVSSRWMAPRLSRRAHLTTKALSCRVSLATERRMLFSMS